MTARAYAGQSGGGAAAARRHALVAAGLELFGTRSYDEVTIADIVSEAGVNRRAFYECFPDREALLKAVHDEIALELAALTRIATRPRSPSMTSSGS